MPRPLPHCLPGPLAAFLFALLFSMQAVAQDRPLPPQPTLKLSVGLNLISAEVAKDNATRQIGLMHRKTLAPGHGMLFIFEFRATQCMWMRNTLIPLSVAFIGDDGRIVNVEDMQPKTEDSHCSAVPVRYALEMPQGWFAQRKLGAGSLIKGIPGVQ